MAVQSLAVKYRPSDFSSVTEQGSVKTILTQQLETNTTKNAYLFCGGAGTGKTTCARIFAHELNKGQGNPIEMDAASNNSVDDVREIIQQAKTKSLDSEYKVFIIDECHALSNTAWQAMLKLIEEPPAKSIFIFATTDPQKIPKTILSRVQRYDFQRISHSGIVDRLDYICRLEQREGNWGISWNDDAIDYIAKIADGGMRDAITLLDKCLAYSVNLTIENVIKAVGATDYDTMFELTDSIVDYKATDVIRIINAIHNSGKDLKLFIKSYMHFVLDLCKYDVTQNYAYLQIPHTAEYDKKLTSYGKQDYQYFYKLLKVVSDLSVALKWDTNPRAQVEATLLMECVLEDEV